MGSHQDRTTQSLDALYQELEVNSEKVEFLKEMETKIFNPMDALDPKDPVKIYKGQIRNDLYTITEMHLKMLSLEERAIRADIKKCKLSHKLDSHVESLLGPRWPKGK